MLDTAGHWRVEAQDDLRAEALVLGRPVAEARETIGRVFTLCRAAQLAAFDIATGRPADKAELSADLRREHLVQIFMGWPHALGIKPLFDRACLGDDGAALHALFGPPAQVPANDFDMAGFLGSDDGVAPLLRVIGDLFGPRGAVADGLPFVDAESAFRSGPVENSPAARQAATPAMNYVEAFYGRGPLWRATGRVIDLAMVLTGATPRPPTVAPGSALVPAPRGNYAFRVATEDGCVTALSRVTPTDHMLAPGGALEAMLASLPAHRNRLMPLLLALIDPCRPVNVEVARDA
jgi:hypothetical protein